MSEKMALGVKPLDLEGYRCSGKCPVFGKDRNKAVRLWRTCLTLVILSFFIYNKR